MNKVSRIPSYDYIRGFYKDSKCELLEDEYINNTTPMKFKCSCGELGEKTWEYFRLSPRCNECGESLKRKNKNVLKGVAHTYEYVKNFIEVESESGCILLSENYTNNRTPLEMLCSCGEEFSVTFKKFRAPNRKTRHCKRCTSLIKSDRTRLPYQEVRSVVEGRGCRLISGDYVDAKTKISIACACGEEYDVSYDAFRSGQDRCSTCSGKISKLELTVEDYLVDNGISFKTEFTFEDCRSIDPLPFDFAVMNEKNEIDFLIEADGQQHFYPVEFFGGEEGFKAQQARDKIKDEFCLNNDITLVRIPYYDIDDIGSYLINLI